MQRISLPPLEELIAVPNRDRVRAGRIKRAADNRHSPSDAEQLPGAINLDARAQVAFFIIPCW